MRGEAIVRVHDAAGRVVGTGFLATGDLVLTCAHVLGDRRPDGPVEVDFPLLPGGFRVRAHVVAWHGANEDGSGDTAVLRLTEAPPGAVATGLAGAPPRWGEQVRVFGFPPALRPDHGVWVEAELRAANGAGWVQIESTPGRRQVGTGFSGSPVFARDGVVGMVVAAERGARTTTAYVLPVPHLLAAHPDIAAPDPRETSPYRGLEPFHEEHAPWFRGRDAMTAKLVDLVDRRPVVVVAGPSGSGKSSLVRAGLVPAVRRRGTDVRVFRVLSGEPALTSLGRALSEDLADTTAPGRVRLAERLLSRSPDGLLVFVDQFEEASAAHPDEARELFELLVDLAVCAPRRRDGSPALSVVVTLRSGALDALVTDRTADEVADGVLFVPPMTRDQLAEAVRADGVRFEPGLVERILDDAGTEPGTLPLVEFALARLWDKRGAGVLTHAAYDESGGVTGALAGYAEQLYERLDAKEQQAARRLLLGLARPDGDGGFLRRPLDLSDLDEHQLPVLAKLSTARLVVVGRADDDTPLVELAHNALLHRWPRLREWLAQERDFLAWREQLRADLARWHRDDRDPGGLLRGAALARAEEWADADLTTEEREYVHAGRAREQRRRRRLWAVVAMISVLAVVAAGLAVWASNENRNAQEQLARARSRSLAEDSERFRRIDPRTSLQLAQAAWAAAETPEAYGALFTQYTAVRSVDEVLQGRWEGDLRRVMVNADGSRLVAVGAKGARGWAGEDPDWALPPEFVDGTFQLSPSGRLVAYDDGAGRVAFWDRQHPWTVLLRDAEQERREVRSMAFSADETRLLIWRNGSADAPEFEVWDLARREEVAVADGLGPRDRDVESAFLGPTPGTIVLGRSKGAATVHDLTTGREVLAVPPAESFAGHVARNGTVLAQCGRPPSAMDLWNTLTLVDLATGARGPELPVPDCVTFELDSSSNFAIFPATTAEDEDSNTGLSITDLVGGRSYRMTTAAQDLREELFDDNRHNDKVAAFTGADGRPVVLIGNQTLLYRHRPEEFDPTVKSAGSKQSIDPSGRYGVTVDTTGAIALVDLATEATVATKDSRICWRCTRGRPYDFATDGQRLVTVQEDTLVVYSVPGLEVTSRSPLPLPDLGGPPTDDGLQYEQWTSSVVAQADGQVTVLHAGALTRWNPTDGTQIGSPTPVREDRLELRRSAHRAVLELRPRHRDQAVVLQPDGEVELWDLDAHARVTTLGEADTERTALRFTSDGSRAAVLTPDHDIRIWDIDQQREVGRPIPVAAGDRPLGFTPDGRLVTVFDGIRKGVIRLWDPPSGKLLGTLTWPAITSVWRLEDDRLTMFGFGPPQVLEFDPAVWFQTLCRHSDRDFTEDERRVLAQLNAPDDRPCS